MPATTGWQRRRRDPGGGGTVSPGARRNFLTTSACGVCGKTSIRDICVLPHAALAADQARFDPAVLACLPDRLRDAQRVFARTGGLHAAGLFTATGELIAVREDVGRHNAVDKVVGRALLETACRWPACVLLVSGRASFELVQKAVLAGIPLLAAVSAPSSLAAELAEEAGLTLVGFLRGRSMNVTPERTGYRHEPCWSEPRERAARPAGGVRAMDGRVHARAGWRAGPAPRGPARGSPRPGHGGAGPRPVAVPSGAPAPRWTGSRSGPAFSAAPAAGAPGSAAGAFTWADTGRSAAAGDGHGGATGAR